MSVISLPDAKGTGRRGLRRRARAVLMIGPLLAIVMAGDGAAQSWDLSAPSVDRGGDARPFGRGRNDTQSDAARMLDHARQALERGDPTTAQQQLELLVDRHPNSQAASIARRELSRAMEASRSGVPVPAGPPAIGPSPELPTLHRPPIDTARSSTRIQKVRLLDEDFRAHAGDRVFFAEGMADLGARARAVLAAQARWLSRHPQAPITIEAHADDHGSREANMALSMRRAEAVRDRLIAEGVEAS